MGNCMTEIKNDNKIEKKAKEIIKFDFDDGK